MKRIIISEMILISFIWSSIAIANIYTWTDKKGVRHFSNQSPPASAEIFLEDSGPNPEYSPETDDQMNASDPAVDSEDLEDLRDNTRDKLLETLEKVDVPEYRTQAEKEELKQLSETVENEYVKSSGNDSYSASEDTYSEDNYDEPVRVIRNNHLTQKSRHYRHHRYRNRGHRHPGDYYYQRNHRNGYYTDNEYNRYKKYRLKGNPYKRYHYDKRYQQRHRYNDRTHHRSRRLGVHHNRRHLTSRSYGLNRGNIRRYW